MTAVALNALSGHIDFMQANAWQFAICMNVPDPTPGSITLQVWWHTSNGAGYVNGVPNLYAVGGVETLGHAQGDPLPFGDWVGRIDGALTLITPDSVDEGITPGIAEAIYTLPSSLLAPYAGLGVPPASTVQTDPADPAMSGLVLRTNVHKAGGSFGPLTPGDWYRVPTSGSNTGKIGVTTGNTTGQVWADATPPEPPQVEVEPLIQVRAEIRLHCSASLDGD